MLKNFIRHLPFLILLLVCSMGILTVMGYTAFAVSPPARATFTMKPPKELEKAVRNALKEELDAFKKEYLFVPYMQYAFVDLNGDGKYEIIARITTEYGFRDAHDNVDTYVFAQTSKGLYEVLHVMAIDIATGWPNHNGLSTIYVYKEPNSKSAIPYVWDGKEKYIKK